MSDSVEQGRAKHVLVRPIYIRRLRHTPLRDLIRGRVTDRLNWRSRIDAAPLPIELRNAIHRVVRATRLWRLEKSDVTDELAAHFSDGLASGESSASLLSDFGDERAAAKLIRRAKKRNRPLAWHALVWLRRGALVLLALFTIVMARFLVGRPTVSVDYVAQINAPVERIPEGQRAWPVYRKAILALDLVDGSDKGILRKIEDDNGRNSFGEQRLFEVTPTDPQWPELVAWLDAHRPGLDLLRQATAKPHMGFIFGPNGSENDPELGWKFTHNHQTLIDESLITLLLPDLNYARQLANVLEADARYAQSTGDAARAAADFHAMLGIARHQEAPFVITRLVGIGIYSLTFDRLEKSLAANPSIFTDQELIDLAHRISMVGGDTASSLLDLESERMSFRDIMQRMFTDDGHGDGRLTPEGARSMSAFLGTVASNSKRNVSDSVANKVHLMSLSGAASAIASRKENIDEYDRLLSEQERRNARPLRECSDSERTDLVAEKRVSEINASSILYARLWPVSLMTPSLNRAAVTAERLLAQREGLLIGIAMELYQRRHNGQYPPTLDALVPSMLPKVPEDRIVGGPVHYKLVDGKPVIYSVGVDRDDDGGTAATDAAGQSAATAAAEWTQPAGRKQGPIDGDWILYDGRPKPSLPTTRPS